MNFEEDDDYDDEDWSQSDIEDVDSEDSFDSASEQNDIDLEISFLEEHPVL